MQRRRLINAALALVYERGAQAVTIALVSDRAGVSRKTFYDSFENREMCLLAAFEEAAERARHALKRTNGGAGSWRERVRAGLLVLLCFLEEEPMVARMLIVEALSCGELTLDARRRVLTQMIAIVDEGHAEPKVSRDVPPLTAEGMVGAVFSVVHARMLDRQRRGELSSLMDEPESRPLSELAGPLTAMIVQPYLGTVAGKQELVRSTPSFKPSAPKLPADPFKDLPIRLTYRTARVLASIAATPGTSGKRLAAASGVTDDGQMSRLLGRLERAGLVRNDGAQPARGEAKAWTLTDRGAGVQAVIAEQTERAR